MNDTGLAAFISEENNRKNIQYCLAYTRIRKYVLVNRPRSEETVKERVVEYLIKHPTVAKMLENSGRSSQHIISRLSRYAQ